MSTSDVPGLLWDFNCRAVRLSAGRYRVTLIGGRSGKVRKRVGYHPLWELIRLLAEEDAALTEAPKESAEDELAQARTTKEPTDG